MTAPTMFTEDIAGSALSQAARHGRLPAGWMPPTPRTIDAWTRASRAVAQEFAERPWLDALRPAIQPTGVARDRLARVVGGHGVIVTTGQQPGLFGGPLLTLVKALSALALADQIERTTGIPAAPLFWAATDDADFVEAASVSVPTRDGVVALHSDHRPLPGTPMALAPLGDLGNELEPLREACGSMVNPAMFDLLTSAYGSGATIGGAYVALLRGVLEPLGMGVLDASHPAVRAAGGGVMRRALECADMIGAVQHERISAIRAAGFEPQVDEVDGLSLVFVLEDGKKRRLTIDEAGAAAKTLPADSLSPTALLRPVLERALVPTVAYAAGPGELAYFAQTAPLAAAVGVPAPLAVPRWSVTIVEPRIQKVLNRLESTPTDIRDPDRIASRLAKARTPAGVARALASLRAEIEAGMDALARADETHLLPERAIDGVRTGLLAELDRGERRIAAAVKGRDESLARDIRVAHGALFPGGIRQERVLSWVPFLVRYGTPLLGEMVSAARRHADEILGVGRLAEVVAPREPVRAE